MLKIIYGSVYGHTKEYAENFAKVFNVEALSYKNSVELNDNDVIVCFRAL